MAVFHDARKHIVSVGKHVRRHRHGLSDGTFDGEASAIDLRLQPLDDDALTADGNVGRLARYERCGIGYG